MRPRPSLASHLEKYDDIVSVIDGEIDKRSREMGSGIRTLRSIRKKLLLLKKEMPLLSKEKLPKRKVASNNGLLCTFVISDELADFLQVERGSMLSRLEVTCAICVYTKLSQDENRERMLRWKHLNPDCQRNLQDPDNKRAIIPDKKLSKLLGYDNYIRDVRGKKITKKFKNPETNEKEDVIVTDPSLYYYVIQKLVKSHLVREEELYFTEDNMNC